MENPYIQDIVWTIKDEASKQGLGVVNWELIVIRLMKEGYINEDTKSKQDKT